MSTEFYNARLIDAAGEREGSLIVEGGDIAYAGPSLQGGAMRGTERIDVRGAAIMPAFIDMHCHLRDPGYPDKETMETGMRAALAGGYATICAMANTRPVLETAEQVLQNSEKAKSLRCCRLIQAAAAGIGLGDSTPTDYAALSKVTRMISNDGNTIFSDAFMRQLLEASEKYGFIISTHCQPERKIVARDIALLHETGGHLHIGHISHAQTAHMVREAKKEGLLLTCEVTPHHLFGYDNAYKVNPPLREKQDVQALIEAVKDGTVDCLSTDHAPHTEADKANGMAGISNIEYAAQIFLQVFFENDIPLTRFAAMSSYHPAQRLGLRAGLLREGYPADIVVLETGGEHVIMKERMISRSRNTPFDGCLVRGKVLKTMVEGEIRYEYR